MSKKNINTDLTDSPTVWFAVLERARIDNDFARAAEAQAQLERLGVRVKFVRQQAEARGAAR